MVAFLTNYYVFPEHQNRYNKKIKEKVQWYWDEQTM